MFCGKTAKILDEVQIYIHENPTVTIYTNDENLKKFLGQNYPKSKVELIKTLPDKTYPNIFWSMK